MLKWIAKKYAVSLVNDALQKALDKVDVTRYVQMIKSIVTYLQSLLTKLEDNQITAEEADLIIDETKALFK